MGSIRSLWEHIECKKDLIMHDDESPPDFMDRIKVQVMDLHNFLLNAEHKDCKLCLQKIEIECISWFIMGINEDLRNRIENHMPDIKDLTSMTILDEVLSFSIKNWDDKKHRMEIKMEINDSKENFNHDDKDFDDDEQEEEDDDDDYENFKKEELEDEDDEEFFINDDDFQEYQIDIDQVERCETEKSYSEVPSESEMLELKAKYDLIYKENKHNFPILNSDGIFQCYICGKPFTSKLKLKGHVKTHYQETTHCNKCDELLSFGDEHKCSQNHIPCDGKIIVKKQDQEDLKKMIKLIENLPKLHRSVVLKFHPKLTLEDSYNDESLYQKFCKFCDKEFGDDNDALKEHLEQEHKGQTKFFCAHCENEFSRRDTYLFHLEAKHGILVKTNHMKKVYSCSKCNMAFETQSEKKQHYYKVHILDKKSQDKHICSFCPKVFQHKESMIQHEQTHTGQYSYYCHTCGKGCTNKKNMTKHFKSCGQGRMYSCSFCESKFPSIVELQAHTKTHNLDDYEAKFKCKTCQEKFITYRKLEVHKAKFHSKFVRTYGCSSCPDKIYKRRNNSVQHIIAHHSNYTPYQCRVCGFESKFECGLRQHLKYNHKDATLKEKVVIYNKNPTLDGIIKEHLTVTKEAR